MIYPKTKKNKALVAWVDNWAAHTTPTASYGATAPRRKPINSLIR